MTKKTASARMIRVLAAALLVCFLTAIPAFAAGGDLKSELLESDNTLADYATESINNVLGPYALLPLDPMFNLAILSGVSLLNHGGMAVNTSIQSAIDSNVLFSNQVLCWIMLVICLLIGIGHLILKHVPGISAATESFISEAIDWLGIAVRLLPYAILILPSATTAAAVVLAPGFFQSAATIGGKVVIGLLAAIAGVTQYLVIKFARVFLDLIVSISPEPVTTIITETIKKGYVLCMWAVAYFAPEVLFVLNIIIFLLALIVARRGYLLSRYCRGLYWKSLKHTIQKKRGSLNPETYYARAPFAPEYIRQQYPDARRILLAYAGTKMGKIPQKVPKYMKGWFVDTGSELLFCCKTFFFFKKKYKLTGTFTILTRWDKCQIQCHCTDGKTLKIDLSTHYEVVLRVMAEEYGWLNVKEEKRRRKDMKKAMKSGQYIPQ